VQGRHFLRRNPEYARTVSDDAVDVHINCPSLKVPTAARRFLDPCAQFGRYLTASQRPSNHAYLYAP
jgi:hypothetical protein